MSNSASYKLTFRATKEDAKNFKKYLSNRNNFPYSFTITHKHNEWKGMVTKELTVQAEERNRSFSGADGYLMELVLKFPEIVLPYRDEWLEHSNIEYDDDYGEGWLSKKEDGFEKLKDYSGKIDLIELSKLETDENDKIVKNTAFNIWMESKDNGKTATVHYETGDAMKVWKGEEEMEQGTYISEPIPFIEAEIKLREYEQMKDKEGFH